MEKLDEIVSLMHALKSSAETLDIERVRFAEVFDKGDCYDVFNVTYRPSLHLGNYGKCKVLEVSLEENCQVTDESNIINVMDEAIMSTSLKNSRYSKCIGVDINDKGFGVIENGQLSIFRYLEKENLEKQVDMRVFLADSVFPYCSLRLFPERKVVYYPNVKSEDVTTMLEHPMDLSKSQPFTEADYDFVVSKSNIMNQWALRVLEIFL